MVDDELPIFGDLRHVARLGNLPVNEEWTDTGALVVGFYYILPYTPRNCKHTIRKGESVIQQIRNAPALGPPPVPDQFPRHNISAPLHQVQAQRFLVL